MIVKTGKGWFFEQGVHLSRIRALIIRFFGFLTEILTASSKLGKGQLSGKIVKEDTLECYSRNQAIYRLLLTETEIFFPVFKASGTV